VFCLPSRFEAIPTRHQNFFSYGGDLVESQCAAEGTRGDDVAVILDHNPANRAVLRRVRLAKPMRSVGAPLRTRKFLRKVVG